MPTTQEENEILFVFEKELAEQQDTNLQDKELTHSHKLRVQVLQSHEVSNRILSCMRGLVLQSPNSLKMGYFF